MAKRVTDKDIREMIEAYAVCGTYSGVAEATGWSVSTVRKYLTKDYSGTVEISTDYEAKLPSIEDIVRSLTGKEKLSTLSAAEKSGIKTIQKGMIS